MRVHMTEEFVVSGKNPVVTLSRIPADVHRFYIYTADESGLYIKYTGQFFYTWATESTTSLRLMFNAGGKTIIKVFYDTEMPGTPSKKTEDGDRCRWCGSLKMKEKTNCPNCGAPY